MVAKNFRGELINIDSLEFSLVKKSLEQASLLKGMYKR